MNSKAAAITALVSSIIIATAPMLGFCLVVAIVGIFAACVLIGAFLNLPERHYTRLAAREAIAERADRQHAAALRGEPYGLYGDYPPPDVKYDRYRFPTLNEIYIAAGHPDGAPVYSRKTPDYRVT